eukprot:COSAG06_NODE_27393_length_594_cov_0.844444_1_plen_152_part_00
MASWPPGPALLPALLPDKLHRAILQRAPRRVPLSSSDVFNADHRGLLLRLLRREELPRGDANAGFPPTFPMFVRACLGEMIFCKPKKAFSKKEAFSSPDDDFARWPLAPRVGAAQSATMLRAGAENAIFGTSFRPKNRYLSRQAQDKHRKR